MLREYRKEEYVVVAREHSEALRYPNIARDPWILLNLLEEVLTLAGAMVSVFA